MFEEPIDIIILILGLLSSLTTSIMNIPLAWKVHKTNDTRSLSKMTLIITFAASVLWVVYSILTMVKGITTPTILLEQWISAALPIFICNFTIAIIVVFLFIKKTANDQKSKSEESIAN